MIVKNNYNESKFGTGILFFIFLHGIGLIIGLAIYPKNTVARKTFIKGWFSLFIIIFVLIILSIIGAIVTTIK